MAFYRSTVLVSVDPVCVERGAHDIIEKLQDEFVKYGLIDEVQILETTRLGDPQQFGPDLTVYPEGTHYTNLTGSGIPYLVEEHFMDEYKAHIFEKRCPAKVCRALIKFEILDGPCTSCTVCARNCPVNAISGERKETHIIDQDICIQCGICHFVNSMPSPLINHNQV